MSTGGYGGASIAIPLLLFIICFPEVAVLALLTGMLILLAFILILVITKPGGHQ